MKHTIGRSVRQLASWVVIIICSTIAAGGQTGTTNGEWRTYGGDLASTRYAPLDQINATNFNKLEVAWRFKTDILGPRPEFNFQSTPLMVNGVLYSTAGTRRAVVALDAATGEMLWMHSEHEGKRGEAAPRQLRAAASPTGPTAERSASSTSRRAISWSRSTRRPASPVPTFGKNGIVDLKLENDQEMDLDHRRDRPARRAGHREGRDHRRRRAPAGSACRRAGATRRATSAASTCGPASGCGSSTRFRCPGEFGNDTWVNDSWSYTGNAGVWAQMTVDEELGLVYLPVELPTGDYYGGHRPGNELFWREPRRASI